MEELILGNARFAAGANKNLLQELAKKGQQPLAAVVSCSDSRIPVELIFNQLDPGRLFVIRVAGNVIADASVKGSIEYSVEHLKVPKLVILGHTGCGAVQACIDGVKHGELGRLVSGMKLTSKDCSTAIIENIDRQVRSAFEIGAVEIAVSQKKLDVYGALYDIATGTIKLLSRNGMGV